MARYMNLAMAIAMTVTITTTTTTTTTTTMISLMSMLLIIIVLLLVLDTERSIARIRCLAFRQSQCLFPEADGHRCASQRDILRNAVRALTMLVVTKRAPGSCVDGG